MLESLNLLTRHRIAKNISPGAFLRISTNLGERLPLRERYIRLTASKPGRLVHYIAQCTSVGESPAVVHYDLETPVVEVGPVPGHMWRQQNVRQRPQSMIIASMISIHSVPETAPVAR